MLGLAHEALEVYPLPVRRKGRREGGREEGRKGGRKGGRVGVSPIHRSL